MSSDPLSTALVTSRGIVLPLSCDRGYGGGGQSDITHMTPHRCHVSTETLICKELLLLLLLATVKHTFVPQGTGGHLLKLEGKHTGPGRLITSAPLEGGRGIKVTSYFVLLQSCLTPRARSLFLNCHLRNTLPSSKKPHDRYLVTAMIKVTSRVPFVHSSSLANLLQ